MEIGVKEQGRAERRQRRGSAGSSPRFLGAASGEVLALAALAFVLVVTALWWALALWPVGADAPGWVRTTRAVCFGAYDTGLPNAGGWILLVGEPMGMVAALYVVWRDSLVSGLRRVAASGVGRGVLAGASLSIVIGVGAAGWRVASARMAVAPAAIVSGTVTASRVDEPAPPLRLVDQYGDSLSLERFAGRPVLVTFAYAHCETVCPLLVRSGLDVQSRLGDDAPALVIVTLDPWRDIPSRLPHIAAAWGMGRDAFVVSGEVASVQRVLASWGVETIRDGRTGEVTHAPITFLVDGRGNVAYATTGSAEEIVSLLGSLSTVALPAGPSLAAATASEGPLAKLLLGRLVDFLGSPGKTSE